MNNGHQIEFLDKASSVKLRGRFVLPEGHSTPPVVMMLTGDGKKGTKSLSWTNLPPLLAQKGIATFLFDFEGLGFSDGDRSKLTLSKGLSNFRTAFAAMVSSGLIDTKRIGILGSSFGATTALLAPETTNRIKALGLKSPASFLPEAYINEAGDNEISNWKSSAYSEQLGYSIDVLLDSFKHNAYASAMQLSIPCLITHGTKDDIVPVKQSNLLALVYGGSVFLKLFHGVGHGYSEEGAWDEMASDFIAWFDEHLNQG